MIGTTLSHFKITAKLGEGGMGEVYLAEDTELDRKVALKVLPQEMAEDPERLERFRREAKAVAALNHPNIVTIHSIEQVEGRRFLIMELVEGESLDRVLPAGGFSLDRVFDIAVPMADALAAAHEKGIVHRDLKPANVMLSPEGRVKVLDFGLAKLATDVPTPTADAATEVATLTGEGTVMGTAPYMSPEQLQGKPVDRRTDIFSFGILLYEMVTGARPFGGESGIDLASSILKDTPAPVTEMRHGLPRHLGRIVAHCLEKDPERRFQSAKDVRNELEGLRDEVKSDSVTAVSAPQPAETPPVSSAPVDSALSSTVSGATQAPAVSPATAVPSGPVPASDSSRFPKWLGIAAALLVVAAVAWWFGRGTIERKSSEARTDEATSIEATGVPPTEATTASQAVGPSVAVLPFADLSPEGDQEYFTDGLTDELINKLTRVGDLRVTGRTSAFQFKGTTDDPKVIGGKLNVSSILEGSVRKAGDQVRVSAQLVNVDDGFQLWSDTYDRKLDDIFQVQDEIASSVAEALQVALLGEPLQLPDQQVDAEAYNLLLQARFHFGQGTAEGRDSSKETLLQAIEIQPDFAPAWSDLGRVHANIAYNLDSIEAANQEYARAEEVLTHALELDPELASAHSRLSWVQARNWDFDAAGKSRQRSLEIAPNSPVVVGNAATLSTSLGHLDEAIELFKRSLEVDPLNPVLYVNMATALDAADRLDDAISARKKLIEIGSSARGNHANLAKTYLRQGRADRALEEAELETSEMLRSQALALANFTLGNEEAFKQARNTLLQDFGDDAVWELAQIDAWRSEPDLAFEWLEKAYDLHHGSLRDAKIDPFLRNLHDDPRWPQLLEKLGLAAD